ncbi:MAG: 3-oxoadipate enol-lactonase [Alphaproteobacteria bacterium]|nr:3-oxoadipate enol-lactonase [Alphaproteobacteria bacterium]
MEIDANGVRLHYAVSGRDGAPWVTLSHSIAADLSFWDAEADALGAEYRVLRYDTRGHGASAVGTDAYSLELLAADVIALWDGLGIDKSHFVGLSLGGMTGMVLGLDHGDRLDRLVIANARSQATPEYTALWDQRIALAEAEGMAPIAEGTVGRWFTEGFIARAPEAVARVRAVIEATPPQGFAGAGRAIRAIDLHRRLGGLSCPTLFIAGADDGACPAADIRADHEAVPGSRYVELAPAAHISNLEQPDAFAEAVTAFLAR